VLTNPLVQNAQAKMTVGLERAHAQLLGQVEGLAVMIFGLFGLRGLALRGNLTEEAQGIRLVTAFLSRTGESQRPLGESMCLRQVTG
jgi:hypothetical protein